MNETTEPSPRVPKCRGCNGKGFYWTSDVNGNVSTRWCPACILHLQEEVERLRADANARAVEELRKLHHRSWYGVVDLDREIDKRIVELSKPAARESEPVRCIASLGDNHCEKGRGHAGLHCCRNVEWSESTQGGEKIETWVDDWTVTLAAQAKVAYVNSAEPADELKVRLLSLVVEGLCNLGREVRRGGKS